MSSKIYREIATKKDHPESQPLDRRYSLFCKPVRNNDLWVNCESKSNNGHLGDYGDSKTAEEIALSHEHPVVILFFPLHQATRYDF